jgi:hypothetical protein
MLKTLSGSSPPIFALSFRAAFSQTQTGGTVPFKPVQIFLCIFIYILYIHYDHSFT